MYNSCSHEEIWKTYAEIKDRVASVLCSMERITAERQRGGFLAEFFFCLLTPQSKAREAHKSIEALRSQDLLEKGGQDEIKPFLKNVRFYNNKASYIIQNRQLALSGDFFNYVTGREADSRQIREYLVKNIIGYGYKEASHFLRNIGRGHNIAILDRHILKGLCETGCICELPRSISRRVYLDLEKKMEEFSKQIKIELSYLDFVFWYRKTGDIFK